MKITTITLMLCISSLFASSQVINIEQERIKTDTTGWSGNAGINFQYIKNQQEFMDAGLSIHLQYKTNKSLFLILTSYNVVTSGSDNFSNAGIQHFRYNYKFTDWFTLEIFEQLQFNKVLNVKFRSLTGTGPRFKIVKAKNFRLYGASLYMYEYEELDQIAIYHRDHRLSSYLSFTWNLGKNVKLINTTYYQPKLTYIGDYRISSQTDFKVGFAGHFALGIRYLYAYDAYPPEGIVYETHSVENSISYEF